jgi:hypothetical protein
VADIEGGGQYILGAHVDATENLCVTARDSCRRIRQTLAVWILTDRHEKISDRLFDSGRVVCTHDTIFIE